MQFISVHKLVYRLFEGLEPGCIMDWFHYKIQRLGIA